MNKRTSSPSEDFIHAVSDFIFVSDPPTHSDVIWIPGSRSSRNAVYAASLYTQGYAPLLVPSGRFAITMDRFAGPGEADKVVYDNDYQTECDFLIDVLVHNGVPKHAILAEDQATYTWQNAQFSRKATDHAGIQVRKAILCCKPFHARRALTYYQAAYPETDICVCPCPYPGCEKENWFLSEKGRNLVLGEVKRCGEQISEVLQMMLSWEAPSNE